MEIIIILIAVSAIIAGFEISVLNEYRRKIKSMQQDLDEREDFIKVLQRNYDRAMRDSFKRIRETLTEK